MTERPLPDSVAGRRAVQQAAVAELGSRGLGDVSLPSLLEDTASLTATSLGADAAQVLQRRSDGTLVVVASVGVAGAGQPVVVPGDRESQAGYTLLAAGPVISDDLGAEPRFSSSALVDERGLRSGVSTVIRAGEDQWGVLMAHSRPPGAFRPDDVAFLQSVANIVGAVIARRAVEHELRASRRQVELTLAAGGLGTFEWRIDTGVLSWSEGIAAALGVAPGDFDGTFDTFLTMVHPEDRAGLRAAIDAARTDPTEHHAVFRTNRADGEVRWIEGHGQLLLDGAGEPVCLIGVFADITERRLLDDVKFRLLEGEQAARIEAESARERLTFLVDAGLTLSTTLDSRSTLAALASLTVPGLADWVVVDDVDDGGEVGEAGAVHVDPSKTELVREARRRRIEAGRPGLWSVRRTMRTGRSELVTGITEADLMAAAVDEEHLALLHTLAPRAAITVALRARGRTLGGLTLVATSPDRTYGPDELALAENLAARAAMAIDKARLFEDRSRVARTLQEALLPPALPDIPGLALAARYHAARIGSEIGGDFYDLFETGGGRWAVVIGDVCGKGIAAAGLTGLVRHTLRAVAMREDRPSRVLDRTNEALLDQVEYKRFCTAALVCFTPSGGGVEMAVCCGGHPPPVIVRAGGGVEVVAARGSLLGVLPDPSLHDTIVELCPGDALVLYTEGVTEARRAGVQLGEQGLCGILAAAVDAGTTGADGLASCIESAVLDHQERASDDIAILVLEVRDPLAASRRQPPPR
ncbi:hypothetical protein BH24ACT3_BH24ACT3_16380 [soil metagenome]